MLVNQTSPPKDVEPRHFFAPCLFPPACQGAANAEEFEDKYSEPILNTTTGITVIVRSLFVRGCFWLLLVARGCLVLSIKTIVHSLLCVLVFGCSWLFLVVCGCSWLFSSFHQNHCALSVVCACFLVVRGCLIVPSRTLSHASLTDIVFFCVLLCSFVLSLFRSIPPAAHARKSAIHWRTSRTNGYVGRANPTTSSTKTTAWCARNAPPSP